MIFLILTLNTNIIIYLRLAPLPSLKPSTMQTLRKAKKESKTTFRTVRYLRTTYDSLLHILVWTCLALGNLLRVAAKVNTTTRTELFSPGFREEVDAEEERKSGERKGGVGVCGWGEGSAAR